METFSDAFVSSIDFTSIDETKRLPPRCDRVERLLFSKKETIDAQNPRTAIVLHDSDMELCEMHVVASSVHPALRSIRLNIGGYDVMSWCGHDLTSDEPLEMPEEGSFPLWATDPQQQPAIVFVWDSKYVAKHSVLTASQQDIWAESRLKFLCDDGTVQTGHAWIGKHVVQSPKAVVTVPTMSLVFRKPKSTRRPPDRLTVWPRVTLRPRFSTMKDVEQLEREHHLFPVWMDGTYKIRNVLYFIGGMLASTDVSAYHKVTIV
jgi:hypothetical protein